MKEFKTDAEKRVGRDIAAIYDGSTDTTETKIECFPRYVRRQQLKRFIALYELFKLVLPVKGSIVDCGVFRGFSFMSWAKISSILEPENLTRRVYGFDTFDGFPQLSDRDQSTHTQTHAGDLRSASHDELLQLLKLYDDDRFLGHIPKASVIRGDMALTIPKFVDDNPHLVVSLLFLDADLYEPTKVAIESFAPRMHRGSILAFDELDNPQWPGETLAALDAIGLSEIRLERFEWDPYISFARWRRPLASR